MLEKFKANLQKKIEENAIKSELTWKDKEGEHTDIVYLKRSKLPLGDWGRIYPPVDENGKINKINLIFGGKKNFIKLLIYFIIIALFFLAYGEIAHQYSVLRNMSCVQTCIENLRVIS